VYLLGFHAYFLVGILIFKGLTARRLYKSFGVKGLTNQKAHLQDIVAVGQNVPSFGK
jgi:hypothetical protein